MLGYDGEPTRPTSSSARHSHTCPWLRVSSTSGPTAGTRATSAGTRQSCPTLTLVGDHVDHRGRGNDRRWAPGLPDRPRPSPTSSASTTLDQLNSQRLDALAAFDAARTPCPGNGFADIYGCQESWTCDNIITSQIAFSGWENIQQTIAGYDAQVAEAIAKADAGEPMIIYTWTPSAYITNLIPGDNVVWLGVDEVLDDSNPLGEEGGEAYSQLPGTASIGEEQCPSLPAPAPASSVG